MDSSRQPSEKQGERPGFPWRAILISLTLHGLALGMLAPQWLSLTLQSPPAPRLEGRLVVANARDQQSEPDRQSARQFLAAKHETHFNANPVIPVGVSPASTSLISTPAIPAAAGGESVPRIAAEPPTLALATAFVERGNDAAGLRQFRLALAGEARQLRRYPEMARRAGLAGTTEGRVAVEAGGAVRRADLSRSSGHALLDAAALEMLGTALARTQLPESLRGQSFAVLMPVVFEVED